MSLKFFADIRETFVELSAPADEAAGTASFFIRTLNRKDQMISGLKEALNFSPPVELPSVEFTVRSDVCQTFWREQWFTPIAFVTTEGFQHLFEIGDQTRNRLFTLDPKKNKAPIKTDFCFGISDRGNGDLTTELEFINSKLSLSETKNILVCLLDPEKSKEKEKQIADYFSKHGYNVQTSHIFSGNERQRAWQAAKALAFKNTRGDFEKQIRELGFDRINFISHLNTPGHGYVVEDEIYFINSEGLKITLPLSPMSAIIVDSEGVPQIRYENISSEPGPVCFGKGVELCILDLLALKHSFQFEDIKRLKIDHARTKKYLQLLAQQMRTSIETVVENYLKLFRNLLQMEMVYMNLKEYKISGWLGPFVFPKEKCVPPTHFDKIVGKLIHD